MKTAAIIVAAGRGQRFGSQRPKQYHLLDGCPILVRTVQTLSKHPSIDQILVVIGKGDADLFHGAFGKNAPAFVFGGDTRTQSVRAAIQELQQNPPDFVLIHDAVRPFVDHGTIDAVLDELQISDATAPALPIVDAIKQVDVKTGKILGDADRNQFHLVQTPQGFQFAKLSKAVAHVKETDFHDDLSLAVAAGMSCSFVAGNPNNIKITTKHDLGTGTAQMDTKPKISISATGYDVHKICDGTGMKLCGVDIACDLALIGHSDADVGLHAITDAILGAMALGDIGDHFPPTDPKWKNVDSAVFLSHAAKLANKAGGEVLHVDVTLICEAPKIKPYREQMRARIAEILNLNTTQISVKATTEEGLGFTGRGQGIAAQACVSMQRSVL